MKTLLTVALFFYFATLLTSAQNNLNNNSSPILADETHGRILIGPSKVIYTKPQLPYIMDGSWATLNNRDGSTTFFESAMGKSPFCFRHSGTIENPLENLLTPYIIDFNGYDNVRPSGCWIMNIYKHSDGTLVGFIHREEFTHEKNKPNVPINFFIGLARSTDNGQHWKYCGDIIGTRGKRNIGGVPYLVVNGYFYVYFNEYPDTTHRHLSVARAKITDVMNALANDKVTPFFKYNGAIWQENGFSGEGSSIIPNSDIHYDFHSDATYCKALGKYLITVQTAGESNLFLYQSDDGIQWGDRILLDYSPGNMHPYSSIVGFDADASDDSHEVGSEFYIYICRKKVGEYKTDEICVRKILIK